MALLNAVGDKKLVCFGIPLGEISLLHFCSILFKFHVKKITSGFYLRREFSILSHLCSARNLKLFPFIGCFTLNLAGPSPRTRPPKVGSSNQVKAEVLHQENTHKKLTLLLLFWIKKKKKKYCGLQRLSSILN